MLGRECAWCGEGCRWVELWNDFSVPSRMLDLFLAPRGLSLSCSLLGKNLPCGTLDDKYDKNFMRCVPAACHEPHVHLHFKFSQFPFEVGRILSVLQMRKPRLEKLKKMCPVLPI